MAMRIGMESRARIYIRNIGRQIGNAAYKSPLTLRAYNKAADLVSSAGHLLINNYQEYQVRKELTRGIPLEQIKTQGTALIRAFSQINIMNLDMKQFNRFSCSQLHALDRYQFSAITDDLLMWSDWSYRDFTELQKEFMTTKQQATLIVKEMID